MLCLTRCVLLLSLVAAGSACNMSLPLPWGFAVNFPGFSGDPLPEPELERRIELPPGFSITTYIGGIENVRMLRVTPTGDLLASSPRQGRVYLITKSGNPGYAAGKRVLLDDLNNPHGLALHDGWLYVAEGDAVLRVRFDAASGTVSGTPERIVRGLPSGGNHWSRTIGIGPDGAMYVSIGSSCNVCIEKDPRRAAIVRYQLDGSGEQIYATGLRNAVGFAWQPGTNTLYATDNGRDLLGDDFPPCELDRVSENGFYGWPFANGNRVLDPDLGKGHELQVAASIPPAFAFGAHTAPLGMTFYTGDQFPARYRNAAFVALHGSWNRSKKSGYKVVALFFQADGTITEEDFATGFVVDESVSGRPVDVAVGVDGALFVSDDYTGTVYRIAYGTAAPAPASGAATPTARADALAGLAPAERETTIARGRTLWDTSGCAGCHVAGHGVLSYKPLVNLSSRYDIEALVRFLKTPQPPMPTYSFNEAQRRDLAVYLLSEHP